jgi:hypothetical protein
MTPRVAETGRSEVAGTEKSTSTNTRVFTPQRWCISSK